MSNFLIALLFSLGVMTWIYTKLAKRTGSGNLKPAIIGAGVCGLIIFIIFYLSLSIFLKK